MDFIKKNWIKIIGKQGVVMVALLVIGLIMGGLLGYFYHGYKFKTQLEEARNYEATQTLNILAYGDVTDSVQITCNYGNKETISGKNSGLKFSGNDFNSSGSFVGYDKNSFIQHICGISETEVTMLTPSFLEDKNTPPLFDVILTK